LRRDDSKLTQRVVDANGQVHFVPVLDQHGNLRRGWSPIPINFFGPFETLEQGFLEFYVTLEKEETGEPGRLTESLFRIDPAGDNQLTYVDRITGDLTLEPRAVAVSFGTSSGTSATRRSPGTISLGTLRIIIRPC